MGFRGGLPRCGDPHFVFEFHENALGSFLPNAFYLGQGPCVSSDDCGFKVIHRNSTQNIQCGFWSDPRDMVDEQSEEVAFGAGREAEKNVGIFPDLEMCEYSKFPADRGHAVIAGEGNRDVVSNSPHIYNDMRRIGLLQSALQKGDHACTLRIFRRSLQAPGFFISLGLLMGGVALTAGDSVPELQWRIWMEGSFMRPAAYSPVPAARKTVLAAGRVSETGDLAAFRTPQLLGGGVQWGEFWATALRNASSDLQLAEVRFSRDSNRVIRYAEVVSRAGRASSLVLAPDFAAHFSDTMGEGFFFAVPNRYQCFVFPKLVGDLSRYAELVQQSYRATAYPVSAELFECEKNGIWAVGSFERP